MSQRITKTIFLTAAEAAVYKSTGTCQHVTPDGDTITVSDTDTDCIVCCPEDEPATKAELAEAVKHHYSTTEQVVGTWIDGKPIYEKTILSSQGLPNTNPFTLVDGSSLSVDSYIDKTFFIFGENAENVIITVKDGYTQPDASLNLYYSNKNIVLNRVSGVAWLGFMWGITIRYTKTTD